MVYGFIHVYAKTIVYLDIDYIAVVHLCIEQYWLTMDFNLQEEHGLFPFLIVIEAVGLSHRWL
jgi:hypothetical protein